MAAAVTICWSTSLFADAKSDWAKSFERRRAVLRIDLPTLDPDRVGLLVLSSVRGNYYSFQGRVFDRTPEQLVAKVKSERGTESHLAGAPIEPARLTILKAGSAVTIQKVDLRERLLTIWLWDEFAAKDRTWSRLQDHSPDPPATCVSIEWPGKWSKGFHEGAEIEKVLATVFDWAR